MAGKITGDPGKQARGEERKVIRSGQPTMCERHTDVLLLPGGHILGSVCRSCAGQTAASCTIALRAYMMCTSNYVTLLKKVFYFYFCLDKALFQLLMGEMCEVLPGRPVDEPYRFSKRTMIFVESYYLNLRSDCGSGAGGVRLIHAPTQHAAAM